MGLRTKGDKDCVCYIVCSNSMKDERQGYEIDRCIAFINGISNVLLSPTL